MKKGSRISDELRNRLSDIKLGDKNPMWKGDNVGIKSLHEWVISRFPKPDLCQCCKKVPPLDLANKGIYNRDLKNWEWLCRKCHMTKDGRLDAIHKTTGHYHKCDYCGKEHWVIPWQLKRGWGRFCSPKCWALKRSQEINKESEV